MAIILGIVFMHAGSFKHRIEIQRRHAKFFQIRQFFTYPVQIAAIERCSASLRRDRFIPVTQYDLLSGCVMVIDMILFSFTRKITGETIREDLIKNLIRSPLWADIRYIDGKLLQSCRRHSAEALRCKPTLAIVPQQFETITPPRLSAGEIDRRPPCGDARLRLTALLMHRY